MTKNSRAKGERTSFYYELNEMCKETIKDIYLGRLKCLG